MAEMRNEKRVAKVEKRDAKWPVNLSAAILEITSSCQSASLPASVAIQLAYNASEKPIILAFVRLLMADGYGGCGGGVSAAAICAPAAAVCCGAAEAPRRKRGCRAGATLRRLAAAPLRRGRTGGTVAAGWLCAMAAVYFNIAIIDISGLPF